MKFEADNIYIQYIIIISDIDFVYEIVSIIPSMMAFVLKIFNI